MNIYVTWFFLFKRDNYVLALHTPLKDGTFIQTTEFIKIPLESYVSSQDTLTIALKDGLVYLVKLKDQLKNSPFL